MSTHKLIICLKQLIAITITELNHAVHTSYQITSNTNPDSITLQKILNRFKVVSIFLIVSIDVYVLLPSQM